MLVGLSRPSAGTVSICGQFQLESRLTAQNELIAAIDLEILPKINAALITAGLAAD